MYRLCSASKTDEFSEKFQRGGDGGQVVFNPKIYISDFGPLKGLLGHEIEKKLQYDFSKMGGGYKAGWIFSEKFICLGGATRPSGPVRCYLHTKR